MAFSPDDWEKLGGKFDKLGETINAKAQELHGRITESDKTNARLLNEQSVNLTAKIVETKDHARNLIEQHETKKHDLGKFIAIIAGISAVVGSIIGGILWLIRNAPKG